ncbi:MAG TPA: polyketide synthase, partial [Ramlibacter sp.]
MDGIAIVGIAGRFPSARTPRELWKLLTAGQEATQWLGDDELRAAGVADSELADPNYVKASLVLPDMEMFDADFFGFSKKDAAVLDPQHRHFLECCWEALEDAGHMPEKFDGAVGVFGGCGMQAYFANNLLTNPQLVKSMGLFLLRHTGNDKDFLCTRVSYLLDLKGPSMSVQTACSTSLVAVHVAAQSLLSGECDMALAGGVSIELPHRHGYRFAEGEILSPDGHCRAFDDGAAGTIFGSGAAVVVLRRLDDAIRDGDNIYAVIRGSAVNNDGYGKAGYLAPSVDGQASAAAEALAVAGVDPGSVSYIEAHGTGTPVGDPIEVAALAQAYGDAGAGSCGIGSIKTNIGHLDTAAGAASLIKVALALRNGLIPATLNFSRANSRMAIERTRFEVVAQQRPWPRSGA